MAERRKRQQFGSGKAEVGPIVAILIAVLVLGGAFYILKRKRTAPPAAFAKCLAAKQVTMYGLYWCEHCAEQKQMFGGTFRDVPYVECGIKGSRAEEPACIQAGVKNFPTWKFPDGTMVEGTMPLAFISRKSGCSLQ
jgi:hypothetical protein